MRFISFGSGSSGNSYLFQTGEQMFLIDIGLTPRRVRQYFSDYGLNIQNLKAIFITHDHTDHIKGAGLMSEELQIPVYATAEVHAGMDRNYCMSHKIPISLRRYLTKEEPLYILGTEITPFDVPHDSSDCVGYIVKESNTKLVLMTDVGHITDRMREVVADVRYLIVEANHDVNMLAMGPYPMHLKDRIRGERGHLSNEEGARFVADCCGECLQHVWLCHLSEENNHPEIARKAYEQIFNDRGLNVELTVLKRQVPSILYEL